MHTNGHRPRVVVCRRMNHNIFIILLSLNVFNGVEESWVKYDIACKGCVDCVVNGACLLLCV